MAVMEFQSDGTVVRERKRIAETISVVELFQVFRDEEACYEWLEDSRWHGTPVCPHCGGIENISKPPSKPHHYWHKDCRKQFTVTTKTCMHATKRPLRDWIYAIYTVLTGRKGISAMQLSKELGVQYRTAWHMLHRIREACGRGEFTLSNIVEVDETHVGGKRKNMSNAKRKELAGTGRGPVGKTAVAGARQRSGKVVARPVEKTDAETLVGFVEETVEPGSQVYTDEARAYQGLPFPHDTVKHSASEYVRGEVHINSIESVWAVLKRSIHGTWHHVSPKHLRRYVNEATFRLNEGNCEIDTLDRMRLFAEGMHGKRLSYDKLIEPNGLSPVPVAE
ncbi:MAG: IS1595 family transposase [Rhodospirillaceae bacterium]|nr:IS1595 family transposase [Rhodospirillaceae bacterium]